MQWFGDLDSFHLVLLSSSTCGSKRHPRIEVANYIPVNQTQLAICFSIALNLRMGFHFQSVMKKRRRGEGRRGKEKKEYAKEIVDVL